MQYYSFYFNFKNLLLKSHLTSKVSAKVGIISDFSYIIKKHFLKNPGLGIVKNYFTINQWVNGQM